MYPAPFQISGPPPITTCPHCSILVNGSCVECKPGDTHPSCLHCKDGRFKPPWHKNQIWVAIATATAVTVFSGILAAEIRRRLRLKS